MGFFPDLMAQRLLNRSYLIDPRDRLYRDSVLVRFEDGKLNPTATFTALAEFLDLPYTESMTYCSSREGINPESLKGNVRGFDSATVYRTYDEFANNDERAFLEYFLRDAYQAYGYDFHYYHGEPVDEAWVQGKIGGFTHLNSFIEKSVRLVVRQGLIGQGIAPGKADQAGVKHSRKQIEALNENRLYVAGLLMRQLRFVNQRGQPLRLSRLLRPDPALLEQPLYH